MRKGEKRSKKEEDIEKETKRGEGDEARNSRTGYGEEKK